MWARLERFWDPGIVADIEVGVSRFSVDRGGICRSG